MGGLMPKFAVIANCQASPVGSLLALSSSQVAINRVPPVHTIKAEKVKEVIDAVKASDVVVHQPIGENFGPISIDSLRAKFPTKTYISFPSIYFAGTLPHLLYLRLPGGGTFKGPLGDYHDLRILRGFVKNESQAQCLANFDSFDIDIHDHYQSCLEESLRRDALTDVAVMDVVQERIEANQTFYTFNHCDNHVLWAVARRVLEKLEIKPDGAEKPPKRLLLGGVITAVPSSIVETLGMKWRQDFYAVEGEKVQNSMLVSEFYKLYEDAENFEKILNHNRSRFALDLG
jgi:hypothetical protein